MFSEIWYVRALERIYCLSHFGNLFWTFRYSLWLFIVWIMSSSNYNVSLSNHDWPWSETCGSDAFIFRLSEFENELISSVYSLSPILFSSPKQSESSIPSIRIDGTNAWICELSIVIEITECLLKLSNKCCTFQPINEQLKRNYVSHELCCD